MQPQTILLITSRPGQLHHLAQAIGNDPASNLMIVSSLQEAVAAFENESPVLAVVDHRVGDDTGLDVIRRLINVNAFVHTAILSDCDEDEFHRTSEGLGILTRLPLQPEPTDVQRLFSALRRLQP